MNKSFLTNAIAVAVFAAGYFLDQPIALYGGLFALSGSLTNLLAVHMLFEKVPGLYGSGVIQARFEAFKLGIRSLMMDQFFTKENIDRFLNKEMSDGANLNLDPVIEKIDFNPTFDGLVDVINNSQFGGMLMMFGGAEALTPLREPFVEKMRESVIEITQQDNFRAALKSQIEQPEMLGDITANIETVIEQRLDELTPNMVKDIVQKMIRKHLGWLVVWGGVFGGLIGVVSALIAG
ncbi:DUF445 domain-containing protein [Enterovibrio sp. ZSDZ42]|uniref:DUF445 domain-containing protein n=1 Tax=Enterovibrio gelatinilyticus TaxID=2899819 RepID=A0ABT5R590_9GAMM|nr:DUF445 domain-containing protein [Enterovibrio sp. ZSDZ42]MDD1795439.1 DUF445 domain-containing protein [Enterovibrio sp. ZSDZ42]